MKTQAMQHQLAALAAMEGREGFALFMDMGTGKTWTFLADAERLHAAGKIDSLLVVAPKGVHLNWVLREIPAHLSTEHRAAAYRSGAGKREAERTERILRTAEDGELRIAAINIDALINAGGAAFVRRFLHSARGACMVVDESDLIKNPVARRTKAVHAFGRMCAYRRIGTGTPVPQGPPDLFAQMEFLGEGLLGQNSMRAFMARYAELLPPGHGLVRHITARNPRAAPQIVARDPVTDAPRWRNLDELAAKLAPHSFRVTKDECMDLPPKVHKTVFFDLAPAQRAAYDRLERELLLDTEQGELAVSALSSLVKLQQITSGFIISPEHGTLLLPHGNPRMDALLSAVGRIRGQFIVWARFTEELRQIWQALSSAGISAVEYRGETSDTARTEAVDAFQAGDARAFVGQPQSGGVGLTLTAARTVIYYSNDYSARTRVQSEDRAHRKGTRGSVLYLDLAAADTIDASITSAHQRKLSVSAQILQDRNLRFRG